MPAKTSLAMSWTPLHEAAFDGDVDKVWELLAHTDEKYDGHVNKVNENGATPLHVACKYGYLNVARVLIGSLKADMTIQDGSGATAFMLAIKRGHGNVAHALLEDYQCPVDIRDKNWDTVLHYACRANATQSMKTLIQKYNAEKYLGNSSNDKSLQVSIAARSGDVDKVRRILKDSGCDVNVTDNWTPLHYACTWGELDMARMLIEMFKADITFQNNDGVTAIMLAIKCGRDNVAHALLEDYQCPVDIRDIYGNTILHYACRANALQSMKILLQKYKVDMYSRNNISNTPLHEAVLHGQREVALALIHEFSCDVNSKGDKGRSVLHIACKSGNINLIRALVCDCKADLNARDYKNVTPLHVAVYNGKLDVALALIQEFGCDINSNGLIGRTALHYACAGGHVDMVNYLSKYISPLVVDSEGNTPLHTCCKNGNTECVKALLSLNAPVLIRNYYGETPKDVTRNDYIKLILEQHMSHSTFLIRYESILKHVKKIYSSSEHITRIFVLGNPGAGKSSFIATLKREGFFESLWRVSESSVPPHTAGIVPSIHTSKHYGRVLFYDFAGDAEYYSSHAAILENLACTSKGDNIFIIVVDLREDSHKISCLLIYWVSFIQCQQFKGKKPQLVILGSHLDLVKGDKVREFEKLCYVPDSIGLTGYFLLDCCKPRSREISRVVQHITTLVKDSPCYSLSDEGRVLLGLLEMDFHHVTACSIQTIISHIEDTKVCLPIASYEASLPTDVQSLSPILFELHELGLLFMIKGDNDVQLVLNMSRLTHDVHQLLFSEEATERLRERSGNASYFHIGIVSEAVLSKILPAHITKEILIQLQYCKGIFSSSDSSVQSYLFFPALCSAEKSDIAWDTPPDLSYGIGWLARCTDPRDYFPPRFHHVLFLRLVCNFVLSDCDHKYFLNYFKMWKTGLYWITKQGVECMVELKNTNTEVVVMTKAEKDIAELCTHAFNDVLCCIMNAKAEFCHTIDLNLFLLDSTDTCYNDDNLFPLNVAIESPSHKRARVMSVTRKRAFPKESLYLLFSLWHDTLSDLSYGTGWFARCSAPFPQQFCCEVFHRLIDKFTPKSTSPSGTADKPYQHRCTLWKTGLHWSMREGVECIVEIVHDNRGVVIRVNSESDKADVCATVIKDLIQCVLEAKAEFCHTVRPQFFLLNSTSEADYLNPDNLFAMSEVNLALTSEGIDMILSTEGKGKMKCSKVLWMRKLTHWDRLFPIAIQIVLHSLKNIVGKTDDLGEQLVPHHVYETVRANIPTDVKRRKEVFVKEWMNSSQAPPCWCNLVSALKMIERPRIAEEIEREYGKWCYRYMVHTLHACT